MCSVVRTFARRAGSECDAKCLPKPKCGLEITVGVVFGGPQIAMARSRTVLAPLATASWQPGFAVSGWKLRAKVAMACVAALFNSYSFVAPRQVGRMHGISLIPRSARPEASILAAAITAAVAPAAAQAAVDMPEAGHLILQDEVHSCTY